MTDGRHPLELGRSRAAHKGAREAGDDDVQWINASGCIVKMTNSAGARAWIFFPCPSARPPSPEHAGPSPEHAARPSRCPHEPRSRMMLRRDVSRPRPAGHARLRRRPQVPQEQGPELGPDRVRRAHVRHGPPRPARPGPRRSATAPAPAPGVPGDGRGGLGRGLEAGRRVRRGRRAGLGRALVPARPGTAAPAVRGSPPRTACNSDRLAPPPRSPGAYQVRANGCGDFFGSPSRAGNS